MGKEVSFYRNFGAALAGWVGGGGKVGKVVKHKKVVLSNVPFLRSF